LYTDGLTDVTNTEGELFNLDRLVTLFEAFANQSIDGMSNALFASLVDFQGQAEQYDDMSLLVMEVV